MIKNEKGITLVALIVTVIVLLLILSTSVYVGIDTYKEATVMDFISKMQILQSKVNNLVADEDTNLGSIISQSGKEQEITSLITSIQGEEISTWDLSNQNIKYFSVDDIQDILDLDGITFDIVVNFTTREIVSLEGIEYKGNMYYTQYNLQQGQKMIQYDGNWIADKRENELGFGNILITHNSIETENIPQGEALTDNINCYAVINNVGITNGTLRYKIDDGTWNTISSYTVKNKDYGVIISKSGTYTFSLIDNTSGEEIKQEKRIEIVNSPKANSNLGITSWSEDYDYSDVEDSSKFAYAEVDGITYVWIPRLAYNGDDEIAFLYNTSNLATNGIIINETWTVSDEFEDDEEKPLTGIWGIVQNQGNSSLAELLANYTTLLPNEYKQVAYIEFISNTYINTGIIPTNHTTKIKYDFVAYNNDEHLFGTAAGASYYHFTAYSNKYYWGRSGNEANGGTWTTGIKELIYNGDNNSVILDGTTLGSGTNITSSSVLLIGSRNGTANLQAKIYKIVIIDKETGDTVRHLIPCLRKNDNVPGFYDIIEDQFYTNQGSGAGFIAGQ